MKLSSYISSIIIISFLFSNFSDYQKVDTVIISGNKNTKDYIIKREILHPINSSLDSLILKEDINRLYNLGIFSTVVIHTGDFNDDQTVNVLDVIILVNHILSPAAVELEGADLNNDGLVNILDVIEYLFFFIINVENNIYHVNLVESFSIIPDLVIDYNETLNKWSYGLGLAHINFMGLNQSLYFGGAFIGEKWFALSLYNPWVYGDHVSLKTELYNRFSENPFYDFRFNETYFLVESGFYKGLNNRFQFGLSFYKNKKHTKKYHCSDSNYDEQQSECENNGGNWATLLPSNEKDLYKYINIDFNYQHDTRDIYKDPLKGSLFKVNMSYSKSLINHNSDIGYFDISFEKFFLLKSKYLHEPVLSYQVYTLLKIPEFNQLPVHEYEYIGGLDYVKGYSPFSDDFNIEVSNIIYNHFEFQSTIFKRKDYGRIEFGMDGLLFINYGIGSKKINSFSLDNFLVGYGFGFKIFVTGPPPISIMFGFNPYGENHIYLED